MNCRMCKREFTVDEIDAVHAALVDVEWFSFYVSRYGAFENIPLLCNSCLDEIDPDKKLATLA